MTKTALNLTVWLLLPVFSAAAVAQSVCLPAPRLLRTVPPGGQAGTSLTVTITGDHLDEVSELRFSHPGITATAVQDPQGQRVPDQYTVSIAADCPPGVHEARVMTGLGISTSRVFSVGNLPEISQAAPNTTLETALPLQLNQVCNAAMTARSIDHYSFQASQGQRVVIDCAAGGIDSKLKPVLIVADAAGNDLLVERRGGRIDFSVPADGQYIVKVHDLTFKGGTEFFYRLVLHQVTDDVLPQPLPATVAVNSFSWPPAGLPEKSADVEAEPNNQPDQAMAITLPCDLSGSFFPAADRDLFEFTARQGEVWWIEVGSERIGRPTDPSLVVQHISRDGDQETVTDVVQLTDIASPVKRSSNGYAYDGPPYNAGSTDILGKLEIQQDGLHRLQLSDLFGGTRNDPENVYRLVIRKAAPDFALVAWAMHMELRNGDRNALSKPVALRGGATMPLEVVVVRRDGFDGEIDLFMDNLPDGVTAAGLKIPAGQNRGLMLITADQNAPPGLTSASFYGQAQIDGQTVTRPCRLTSMAWPIPDAWQEVPSPRLLADVPVSVGGSEFAPLTIAPADTAVQEVTAGQQLSIPLVHTRRSQFSGAIINLKTFGAGFDHAPAFEATIDVDTSTAVLDLAALKTPPGDYRIAFYGSAVAKYQPQPDAATKDIVDIVVSEPVSIRVLPAGESDQK